MVCNNAILLTIKCVDRIVREKGPFLKIVVLQLRIVVLQRNLSEHVHED